MSANKTFILYDTFSLAHFDNKLSPKRRSATHDCILLERAIRRVVARSRMPNIPADDAATLAATLIRLNEIARNALSAVSAAATKIDAEFAADPLAGDLIDHSPGVECALSWNDERVWIMVRALLLVDTSHRKLVQLRQRGAFDINALRAKRTPLIRPWRFAVEEIIKSISALPRRLRRMSRPTSRPTRSKVVSAPKSGSVRSKQVSKSSDVNSKIPMALPIAS